jgi:RHS repeat-associated protein
VYFRQDSSFNTSSDYFSPKAAFYVVDNVSTQTTANDSVSVNYQYGGLLLHKKGRGLAGFEALRTIDNQSGVITETAYNQHWPYIGMPLSTVQMKDSVLLSSSNNTLRTRNTASGAIMPYISQSVAHSNSLGSDLNKYEISNTTSTFTYDSYGNLTNSTVHIRDAQNNNNGLSTYSNNTYGSNTLYKQKGRLTYSTVQKALYHNAARTSNITRKSSFTYYANDLLLKTSTVSPENNKTKQTTTTIYDAAGNKVQTWLTAAKNSVGSSFETRKTYTTFDSRYRYVQSIKNHLNEATTFTYNGASANTVRGLIDYVETTDTNGIKSRKYQNLLGQVTQSRLYGKGQINSYTYRDYCSNTSCANSDAYVRMRSLADGQAEKQQFLDAWGRELESRVKLQDGSWSVSKTTYDSQGRVKRSYEPGKNSASSYYSEPSYDILGRITENKQADGGFSEIERYGKQTFTTNAKGQRTETLKNYLGQNARVFDTITNELRYQYNAFGQLLNVRAINRSNINSLRTSTTYDVYGNKLTTNDQDKGLWRYTYSGFGELLTQTDAKSQSVSFAYDVLGRKIRRYDASGTVCWDFGKLADKTSYRVGKLKTLRFFEGQNQSCTTSSRPSYQQTQTYHRYGLPYQQTVKVDGASYTSATTHDNYHRVYTQTYPANNFVVRNVYQHGYMTKQLNHKTGRVYRHIESVNGRGQATDVKYANGSSEKRSYRQSNGWLTNIDAKVGMLTLHGFDYEYDNIGNLTDRDVYFGVGNSSNFAEHYTYDDLNRVTGRTIAISNVGGGTGGTTRPPRPPIDECSGGGGSELLLSKSMQSVAGAKSNFSIPAPPIKGPGDECLLGALVSQEGGSTSDNTNNQYSDLPSRYRMNETYRYDDWGNIKYKQHTGYYKYDTNKTNRLLGVYQTSNFTGSKYYSMSYDANGNVTYDGKRRSYYTHFDKPYLITQGGHETAFSYGPNREVYKRVDTRDGQQTQTLYLGGYERVKLPSGVIEHKFYVGNAVITERSNNANDEFYLHKDHQGSTTSITNANGSIVQQFIYDPWGKQYNVHSNSIFNAYSSPAVSKGYTGHKMVNDMDIIHMNGRTYNVVLGRFMQADPHIQSPMNMQNYNRYSYVLNNPMSYSDPSGYFFKKLFKFVKKYARVIVAAKLTRTLAFI